MTKFLFTEDKRPDSSVVYRVWFNQNNGDMFVNLESAGADNIYKYTDVPRETYEELVNADSVGGYYARRVKGKFASTNLGDYDDCDWEKVAVTVPTPNRGRVGAPQAWTGSTGTTYGLTTTPPVAPTAQSISLTVPAAKSTREFQVTFLVAGDTKVVNVQGSDVRSALDNFDSLSSAFGITGAEVVEVARLGD